MYKVFSWCRLIILYVDRWDKIIFISWVKYTYRVVHTYLRLLTPGFFLAVCSPLTLNNQKEISLIYLHLAASNYERHKTFCSPPSCLVWNSHLHLTVYKNMPDCSNFVTDKYRKNLTIILYSVRAASILQRNYNVTYWVLLCMILCSTGLCPQLYQEVS